MQGIELGVVGEPVAVEGFGFGDEDDSPREVKTIEDPEAKAWLDKIVAAYAAWFALLRLVDMYYLFTVDGRFPEGLEYLYPSDADRLRTISYMQWRLMISIASQSVSFCAVIALVRTKALAIFDRSLRPQLKAIDRLCCCCCHQCCDYIALKLFACCPCRPAWGRLSRGMFFLTYLSVAFACLRAPFELWQYKLNADYGFVNTLTTPVSSQVLTTIIGLVYEIFVDLPSYFVVLLILSVLGSARNLLLAAWIPMMTLVLFIQFNPDLLAQGMGGRPFPKHDFGVGHSLPVVRRDDGLRSMPLNRIYWPIRFQHGRWLYVTRDRSTGGMLSLSKGAGFWHIDKPAQTTFASTIPREELARTPTQDTNANWFTPITEDIDQLPWQVDGSPKPDAYVSVSHGADIRERVDSFARAHGISIGQIYMIDGSSRSNLANAFAAGSGSSKVIGLYDTLFLGDNTSRNDAASQSPLHPLEPPGLEAVRDNEGQVPMLSLLAQAEGVDTSEEASEPVLHSHDMRAMTSAEILGILGHELGHSALGHNTRGIFVQGAVLFVTLYVMGFCVYSPKVPAALGVDLSSMIHVNYLFYTHVAGSLADNLLGVVTNTITRSQEYAADAYSAEVSEEYASALQSGLSKLTVNSNQDPDEPWLYEFIHQNHPSLAHRWSAIQAIKDRGYGNSSRLSLKASAADVDSLAVSV